jgi:hypothetical protein
MSERCPKLILAKRFEDLRWSEDGRIGLHAIVLFKES